MSDDWDGKILGISDTINTKVIPNIEKANRKAEGLSNRVESFFKYMSNNKYLEGEEQKGFGFNFDTLERELHRKFIPYDRR